MAGSLSGDPTNFSALSVGGVNSNGAGFGTLSVASSIQVVAGPTLSKGSADLFTNSVVLSIGTSADASGMTIGQLRVVFAASGISLIYGSGKSVYIIGGSATSGATP